MEKLSLSLNYKKFQFFLFFLLRLPCTDHRNKKWNIKDFILHCERCERNKKSLVCLFWPQNMFHEIFQTTCCFRYAYCLSLAKSHRQINCSTLFQKPFFFSVNVSSFSCFIRRIRILKTVRFFFISPLLMLNFAQTLAKHGLRSR